MAPPLRTVANEADGRTDGSGRGGAPIVRANPLERAAMSAADALRVAHAFDVRVTVDGESLVLAACAHRALIVRGGEP